MERPIPAYDGTEPYVFVSYSHQDEAPVRREVHWLQDQGIKVCYDDSIRPGSEWSESIARAIKGCSCFIYLITPRSVQSEHCRRELNFAIEEGRPILAVYLEPTEVPDGMRLTLNNRQAIHKQEDDWYRDKLLQALRDDSEVSTPRIGRCPLQKPDRRSGQALPPPS